MGLSTSHQIPSTRRRISRFFPRYSVDISLLVAVILSTATAQALSSLSEVGNRTVKQVVVLRDSAEPETARYGIARLEDVLRSRHIAVSEDVRLLQQADVVVLAGLAQGRGPTAKVLSINDTPSGPEALTIRTGITYHGKPAIVLCGTDGSGLMYASLDVAQRIAWSSVDQSPFVFVRAISERPFLRDRGIVMFTMNRSYFESRLHDPHYWERYFDMLAENRINELVLTFGYEDGGYMAPFYPYFFDVPGFPEVRVMGLSSKQQKQNLDSLQTMVRLAAERGIRIKPGIWDHIYRGGGQAGRIAWASDGTHPVPGLVWGLNPQNLTPYTLAALDKFYALFPEIKDTQFRMHNESGLLNSEIAEFWHQVFHFYATRHKDIELELRAKGLDKSVIRDAQAQGVRVDLDTKIWMEQMGLPYHPTHINKEDQDNARQSYADLLEYPQTYHVNWTLWNGGTQRLLEWSDPEYARRLAKSARLYDGQGLAITEMEATKMLSAPPDEPAHDFLSPRYKYFQYEFERYWAFYCVMGRLAYDPETSEDVWEQEYTLRFGSEAGPHVMRAIQLASQALPRIVAASVPYSIFPTTSGWPEMMHLGSLPSYAAHQEGSDIAQFENARDEAHRILNNEDTALRTPEETSYWLTQLSSDILHEVVAAQHSPARAGSENELKASLTDATILAALARYHAARLLGAVNYDLYKDSGSLPAFDAAIQDEQKANLAWHQLVEAAGDVYIDKMYFGTSLRGFPHHWKDELPALEKEYSELLKERKDATGNPDARTTAPSFNPDLKPPVAVLSDPLATAIRPGVDLLVQAKVPDPDDLRWIRLRYRHVNQKEDYQTLPMVRGGNGLYQTVIPGSFITPQWDLMYYIEVVGADGAGRIYPNLDHETPYILQQVRHDPATNGTVNSHGR